MSRCSWGPVGQAGSQLRAVSPEDWPAGRSRIQMPGQASSSPYLRLHHPWRAPVTVQRKKKPLEEGKFWIDCAVSPKRRSLDPAETKQLCIGKIFFWPQMEMRIHELSWLQLWEIFFKLTFAPLWLWLRLFLLFMELPVTAHRTTAFPEIDLKTTVLDGLPSMA